VALFTLSPVAKQQFFDDSGNPLANGRIYTYVAGTTTPLSTYQTSSGTAWGPFVQLDSAGRPQTGSIYLQPGQSYKFIAMTSASVPLWTQDNISAVPGSASAVDITGTAGQGITAGRVCYLSKGNGGTNAGQWYLAEASSAESSTSAAMIAVAVEDVTTGSSGIFRQSGAVDVPGPLTPGAPYYVADTSGGGTSGSVTATAPKNAIRVGQALSATVLIVGYTEAPVGPSFAPCGRLTLTTGVPVTTADVTGASAVTVFYAPYGGGNQLSLFNGTAWQAYAFEQLSIAVPATTNTAYDVFAYDNAGVVTLELTAWTNLTTRATALVAQNGVYVKTGALTRLYLGSFRTTGVSGQTEDSVTKRYVWNYYRRVDRTLLKLDTTVSWPYSLATWRQANGAAANQVEVFVGVAEVAINVLVKCQATNDTGTMNVSLGVGEDSTTAPVSAAAVGNKIIITATSGATIQATLLKYPAIGSHAYVWLESAQAVGITTFFGASSTNPASSSSTGSQISGVIQG